MYSATTSSVTLPLLQQKYPRAHRCRPQNCFRNGANSCNILFLLYPGLENAEHVLHHTLP